MSKEETKAAGSSWFSLARVGLSEKFARRLPNQLTFLRFLLVPLFVVLLVSPTPQSRLFATIVYVIASFTDWLDGYIARAYDATTILGKLLDPLADKVLVTAALVMLAALPYEPRIPSWMVVVLLSREMIITGLRSLAAVKGVVVAASEMAKHKTAWTMLAIICLLIEEPYNIFGVLVNFHFTGMVFLWIALVLSIFTGIQYAVNLKDIFND